jgi:hypothetical protein
VGVAGAEAKLRAWLADNNTLHEPRRVTLIRMLGAGLALGSGGETPAEASSKGAALTPRTPRRVNGLPLDADGRPVGLKASFPDPRYAAVDHFGNPLPLQERVTFHPKPLPPSKRAYHPLAAPPGALSRDGTFDSPAAAPKVSLEDLMTDGDVITGAPAVTLTRVQFSRACAAAGVPISDADVMDVFKKHGAKAAGGGYSAFLQGGAEGGGGGGKSALELEPFADVILAAPQRAMGAAAVRAGPLLPDGPDAAFTGKIVYPPCRTGVFAPTAWDGSLARRSAEPPRESLKLEWAYGVSVAGSGGMLAAAAKPPKKRKKASSGAGAGGSAGVFWVYALGAVGVVLDAEKWRQHFFRGHDDDVLSLAVHPSGRWAATGQAGRVPVVCVWEVATGEEVARIPHEPGDRGIVALAFGPGDGTPAAVGLCTLNQVDP